jgi:hypothetical protein
VLQISGKGSDVEVEVCSVHSTTSVYENIRGVPSKRSSAPERSNECSVPRSVLDAVVDALKRELSSDQIIDAESTATR